MAGGDVLFDARDSAHLFVGLIALLALVAVAVLVVRVARNPGLIRGDDLTMNRAGGVLMLLAVSVALAVSSLPLFLNLLANVAVASGNVSVLQGCVRGFEREVHPENHNIADTYLCVGGRRFHFNSSLWVPGFHNEADVIRSGDGLRIITSGGLVLRIERTPQTCPERA